MTDMNELVLEHLMTEVQEHITTKSMLSSALRERDRLDDQCVALSNQIDTLGKKLIDATAGQEVERKFAHDWLSENTSLKAELLRVADQGEQTCVALRDLIAAANGGSVRFHTSKIREALERGEKHLETLDQEIPF